MKPIRLRIFGEAVIEVGDTQVTPASSHIFALLLLLTLGPKEGWTRRELMEMLFEGVQAKEASHRLRQLLYKLRGMGVELEEERGGLLRIKNGIPSASEMAASAITQLGTKTSVLPLLHYDALVSRSYVDWLEELKGLLTRATCAALETFMSLSSKEGNWASSTRYSTLLLQLDEANAGAAITAAEGLSLQGRSAEAVELLDRFIDATGPDPDVSRKAQQARRKILQAGLRARVNPIRGRTEILSLLSAEWHNAQSSGARVFALVGPPGIGKSRIADAFADQLSLSNARIIRERCDEHATNAPLGVFASLIGSLRSLPGSIGVSPSYLRTLDLFTETRAEEERAPRNSAQSEAARVDLRMAITDLLEAVTRERPLLLVVDDAHWLDPASLAVFTELARGPNEARLLVAMCFRPRADNVSRLFGAQRCISHIVPPLCDRDTRAILTDIAPQLRDYPDLCESIVHDAAGNPFFLYALAKRNGSEPATVPELLQLLATRTYLALSDNARHLLELCLFLDKNASLARLSALAGQGSGTLLNSLRELESADLITCVEGVVRGPHALLEEALRGLVPSSVAGQLHRQIARELSEECDNTALPIALAWDAVLHWLSAGHAREAVQLALRCASHALDIGEPAAGAELLYRVQALSLPIQERVTILDRLIRLATIGRRTDILEEVLQERRVIAIGRNEPAEIAARLTIRLSASRGNFDRNTISQLEEILVDESLPTAIRGEASARLMAHADLHLDRDWATMLAEHLARLPDDGSTAATHLKRTSLVFHTTFGSVERARELVGEIIALHPTPTLEDDNTIGRDYAAFALMRLGLLSDARDIALATYGHLAKLGVRNAAEYEACLLSDIELSLGRVPYVKKWLGVVERIAQENPQLLVPTGSGYYSSAIRVAMVAGDYSRAEHLTVQAARIFQPYFAPRVRAVWLALALRLSQAQRRPFPSVEIDELMELYGRGKYLGGQDTVVEALWGVLYESDGPGAASTMLREYLFTARREIGPPDWTLTNTTAADPAMLEFCAAQRVTAEV